MRLLAFLPLAAATLVSASPHAHLHPRGGAEATITVDLSKTFQSIDGFGFSQAFQRSNQLHGEDGLSAANQTRTLDLLFSNEVGAGLTILRNGIGSSPNNSQDWMMSIEPVSPGSPDAPAVYVWDDNDDSQVWLTQQALSYGVQTIYADAWSAPGYMKTNNTDDYGGFLCGVTGATNCSTGDWKQAYANYLVQYLTFYAQAGLHITHLGWLNEPDLSTPYASMMMDGTQAAEFLEVLAPTLKASGLGTKLVCCDATGWRQQEDILSELEQAGAGDLLDVVSSHGYQSEPKLPLTTTHPVWQTEWADLTGAWTADWDSIGQVGEGIQWANKIQEFLTLSNGSAFLHWIGAENTTTNSAMILIVGDSVTPSKRLWAFAQFSRFVKPGAVRVDVTSSNELLHVSGFRNTDGKIAVQVINNGHVDFSVPVQVQGAQCGNVTAYLTDNGNDLTPMGVQGGTYGASFVGNVPARAMVSFVFG